MKLSLNALYLDLLDDLEPYLPNFSVLKPEGMDYGPDIDLTDPVVMAQLSPTEFAAIALLQAVPKKYKDGASSAADATALENFLLANLRCKEWTLQTSSMLDEYLIGEFRNSLYRFFYPTSSGSILAYTDEFIELGGVGPGASVGSRGTDFYTKLFDGPLSATSVGIYKLYLSNICRDPTSAHAELIRRQRYGDCSIVEGSKISFVAKNDLTSRVICTEPVLNMFAQKGIGELISKRLRRYFGIDLSIQPEIHHEMARIGSLTDRLVTIDLSSASDSIGLSMCREFLPAPVMGILEATRCKFTRLPIIQGNDPGDQRWQSLSMVSSMGNGFTFPLETAIFSCAVEAALRVNNQTLDVPFNSERNMSVFGDDIICKSDIAHHVIRLLGLLGFQTNTSKSFVKGPFRESCGADYFKGQPVRGVYIKSLRTQASRYVAINRLNRWTGLTGISLANTVNRLTSSVRVLPVPLHENNDAGIKMPLSCVQSLLRWKSTSALSMTHGWPQQEACWAETPLRRISMRTIMRDGNHSYLYKRWKPKPYTVRFKDASIVVPEGQRKRYYNAQGVLLAYLHGNITAPKGTVDGLCAIKQDNVKYLANKATTPNWDVEPPMRHEYGEVVGSQEPIGRARWESAYWLNYKV